MEELYLRISTTEEYINVIKKLKRNTVIKIISNMVTYKGGTGTNYIIAPHKPFVLYGVYVGISILDSTAFVFKMMGYSNELPIPEYPDNINIRDCKDMINNLPTIFNAFKNFQITDVNGELISCLVPIVNVVRTAEVSLTQKEFLPTSPVVKEYVPQMKNIEEYSEPVNTPTKNTNRTISTLQGECSRCPYFNNYEMYCNYHMKNIPNGYSDSGCTNPELLEK